MCGRFTLRTSAATIADLFADIPVMEIRPSYNIAPTQQIYAVRTVGDDRQFAEFHWGLIPFWAKEKKIGNRMINARSETVRDKPAFRNAFQRRRCLVLADGFYEWKKTPSGKQPMFIHMNDDRPFCFAGLWERNTKLDPDVESCAIITTNANSLMSEIHDRMPVILPPEKYDVWLDPEFEDYALLQSALEPYAGQDLEAIPVSTNVNKPSYNQPDCIQPLSV